MKISISNLAWDAAEDDEVYQTMLAHSVEGIEVAPTKVWPNPDEADGNSVDLFRNHWLHRNIQVVAMQSLLFGRPELKLFADDVSRCDTILYLAKVIRMAARLGVRVLVFGSPKNRAKGSLSNAEAMSVAVDFFSELGEIANRFGVIVCIEPNPPEYGCDFIRDTGEALELIRRVNHPGFRLHLDSAIMTMNGEDPEEAIGSGIDYLEHFHVSEPELAVIGTRATDHARIASCLQRFNYQHWASIEMKTTASSSNVQSVASALEFVNHAYRAPVLRAQ